MMPSPNCYLLPAVSIVEANLLSGPPDAENQVYDSGATYDTGDEVWDGGHVFRSKIDSNADDTSVTASWDDLGEVDLGADAWTAGTYALDVYKVRNSRLWKSAKASNTDTPGEAPLTSWTDFGPTNRHKVFDLFLNRLSLQKGSISWEITIPSRVTFALIMVPRGGSVRVVSRRPTTDEVVFDKTFLATRDSGGGMYRYFFSPIDQVSNIIVPDLGPYSGNTFEVTITGNETALVGAGQIVFGFAEALGTVTTGGYLGFESFNQVDFDDFGNPSFTNGLKRRTIGFPLQGDVLQNDRIYNALAKQNNRPTAVVMRDGGPYGLAAFGLLREFYTRMPNTVLSETLIEIEGFAE